MTIRLLRSRRARRDVIDHAVYIGEHNPDAAVRFLDAMEKAFQRIASYPSIGAARPFRLPELSEMRLWPLPDFPNHLIFYRRQGDEVVIVRVLHASQDIEAVLGNGMTEKP